MLTWHVINEDEYTMVFPEGELGYVECNALENIVSWHVGPGVLLSFNMGKISFIDSAGVGFLLKMKKLTEKRQGSFEMHHLPKRVKLVIDKLALNEFLNVSKDTSLFIDEVQVNHQGTC